MNSEIVTILGISSISGEQQTQDYIFRKKKAIIQRMKNEKFQNLKGSSKLLTIIHKQRDEKMLGETSSGDKTIDIFKIKNENAELRKIIFKQQSILRSLNDENVHLIATNCELENALESNKLLLESIEQNKEELCEQNCNLKKQLKKLQETNRYFLKDFKVQN
jgi:hypothetical protein